MDQKKGLVETIKGMFFKSSNESPPDKKSSKYQYVLLVFLAGIAFMLISNLFSTGDDTQSIAPAFKETTAEEQPTFSQKKDIQSLAISEYEERYENQMKEALEAIVGVGEALVVVNVDATETKVLERNTVTQSQTTKETDKAGGEREVEDLSKDDQVVIIRTGDQEAPIVIKIEKPQIRSVLVVAKGVDNIKIKQMVVEAVTKGFDVPAHKVSVQPKKS